MCRGFNPNLVLGQLITPKKKNSKMSRLKRKPGETLQEWVNRVSKKKPIRFEVTDINIITLSIIVFALFCVLIIEVFT